MIAFDKNASSNNKAHGITLVQTGLLHDADEFLLADFTITITVGFINHLLQLLVCHVLTQLLSNTLEVSERDLASLKRKALMISSIGSRSLWKGPVSKRNGLKGQAHSKK